MKRGCKKTALSINIFIPQRAPMGLRGNAKLQLPSLDHDCEVMSPREKKMPKAHILKSLINRKMIRDPGLCLSRRKYLLI